MSENQTLTVIDRAREWARGIYPTEAGVDLLARGGYLYERAPWITPSGGVDVDALLYESGVLSGGQQRIIRIAASLLAGRPVDLSEDVPGLDRRNLTLVLAAIAHANGSHEDSDLVTQADGAPAIVPLDSLYPWPATTGE